MSKKATPDDRHFNIGAVAKMTGLTDHTIRVWERRYEAIVAERTATGRRRYTAADVEKLSLLKRLTDHGVAISQIAGCNIDELRRQAADIDAIAGHDLPERIRVAVVGELLPEQLHAATPDLAPVEIVLAETDEERFLADLDCVTADVIVMETGSLDQNTFERIDRYAASGRTERIVLAYNFGRSRDAASLVNRGVVLLRTPVLADELRTAVIRAVTEKPGVPRSKPQRVATKGPWIYEGEAAPRQFSQRQIANLMTASSSIDCECPKHLAELVSDLSAFEVYSANCASRNEEDAALHRYLHRTTAEARSLVEAALKRVADAEGISY